MRGNWLIKPTFCWTLSHEFSNFKNRKSVAPLHRHGTSGTRINKKNIILLMEKGKMNELGFEYKTKKARTEQQHSKKRKGFKEMILKKWRFNKKRGILEKSKKGSKKREITWMD